MTDVDPGQVSLEHLHRYSYAAGLLRGRRVLDLASREGYGTRLLAEAAQAVIGMDVDATVVQYAALRNRAENLQFLVGSGANIPISHDHAFDAVVCFEAIDEGANLPKLLGEVKRVLTPGGLFFVSAPSRSAKENLFHAKPFSKGELREILNLHFQYVQLFQQSMYAGSTIRPDSENHNGLGEERLEPQYLIGIASDSPLTALQASSYRNGLISFLREKEKAVRSLLDMKAYQDETLKRQERQLAERRHTIATLQEAFAWHTSRIESLEKTRAYRESQVEQLRQSLESQRKALEWRKSQVESLENTITSQKDALAWRATQIEYLEGEARRQLEANQRLLEANQRLEELCFNLRAEKDELRRAMTYELELANKALEAIHATAGWQFILKVRAFRNRLMPEGSTRYRFYNGLVRQFRRK